VSLLLAFIGTFAVAFLVAFYLERVRGWPAARAGLLLTPVPLTIALVSPATGALADRIGTRRLAATGMFVVALALSRLAAIEADTAVPHLVAVLLAIGVGQAMFQPPNSSALMGAAPRERQGVAAGVLATGRVVGQSLSIALAGALFGAFGGGALASRHGGHGPPTDLDPEAARVFIAGLHAAFIGCAASALLASVTALVRGDEARPAAAPGGRS
jgi:MFS family permease